MVIENTPEDLPRVFSPVKLAFGKEAADTLIVTLPALNYSFLGFIKTDDGVRIFLSDGKSALRYQEKILFLKSTLSPTFPV